MITDTSTIAAIATAHGRGGIGIIRLSGSKALAIAAELSQLEPAIFIPRYAKLSQYFAADGTLLDEGISLYFPDPHSFTGEDVVELQTHGSPVVLDLILQRLVELGAQLARPGEFSERAFLNDKLDLAQAEAIADLIDATTSSAAKAAVQSLQGVFSQAITELNKQIIHLRMYVEAAIDFPEEEGVDFIADGDVVNKIAGIKQKLEQITVNAQQGQLLRDGLTIVLSGRPNAGKSSLLNCLAGDDRAIVTDIAGTTRDTLRETVSIDGLPVTIIDTAGLRDSADPVEVEGIKRAKTAIQQADHVLYLVDSLQGMQADDRSQLALLGKVKNRTILFNKVDLKSDFVTEISKELAAYQLNISAKQGMGIDILKKHIRDLAGFQEAESGQFLARRRHLVALARAKSFIAEAESVLLESNAGELAAEELRLAHLALAEITGEFSADDLLGVIFSQFCIGK
jgi:tRNA modification GTPase